MLEVPRGQTAYVVHTLMRRPLNRELSIASAASTNSGSANSTYAYLIAIRRTQVSDNLVRIKWSHIPFGMSGELVAEDSHSVDGATGLEVLLNFFGCSRIVHLFTE